MKFFNNCSTIEEVKATYRNLAKENHPDLGGSVEMMQAINAEYAFAVAAIAKGQNLNAEEANQTILDAEAYRAALSAIITLPGLDIELVGNWIWVGGNTYPAREALKGAGFYFASKKKMWYFRTEEFSCKGARNSKDMDQIRGKYGSQKVNGQSFTRPALN